MNLLKRLNIRTTTSEGFHNGQITEFYSFTNSKGIEQLCLTVQIEEDDCLILLRKYMPAMLYEGSPIFIVLESLDMLPEENEEFMFDSIIGLEVEVKVFNVTKSGKTYSNISSIGLLFDPSEEEQPVNERPLQNIPHSRKLSKRRHPISPRSRLQNGMAGELFEEEE